MIHFIKTSRGSRYIDFGGLSDKAIRLVLRLRRATVLAKVPEVQWEGDEDEDADNAPKTLALSDLVKPKHCFRRNRDGYPDLADPRDNVFAALDADSLKSIADDYEAAKLEEDKKRHEHEETPPEPKLNKHQKSLLEAFRDCIA